MRVSRNKKYYFWKFPHRTGRTVRNRVPNGLSAGTLDRPYKMSGIVYILGVKKKYSADKLMQTMVNMVPEIKEDIMTAAQQLEEIGELRGRQDGIEEGMERGRRQGRQDGIREGIRLEKIRIAEHMRYKLRLDRKTVAQATGLSEEELK